MDITIDQQVALDEALVPHGSRLKTRKKHKDAKKSNEMYYPQFTKVIVNFFMTKDQSILRRNKYGAILPVELTNEAIRNLESYKEYYAIASEAKPRKTKASVKKKQSSSNTIMPPPTTTGKRLKTSAKVGQPAKSSKAKGITMLSKVALTKAEQIKLATKRSLIQTHISHASGSGADEVTGIIPGVLDVPTYESDDEEISWKSSEDDDDDDEEKMSKHDDDVDDQISGSGHGSVSGSGHGSISGFESRVGVSQRLSTLAKGKQPAKSSKAKDEGTGIIPGVPDVPTYESNEEISWKSSDEDDDDFDDQSDVVADDDDDDQDDNDDDQDSDKDGVDFVHPKLSTHDEEAKDDESFDPIVQTPSHEENSNDEGNDDASHDMNVGGDEGHDAEYNDEELYGDVNINDMNVGGDEGHDAEYNDEELYGDVNINMKGRDVQMTDVHTTQVLEDTHVTLTSVNPDVQQQSSSVSSQFVTSMFNQSLDTGIDSLFESTPRVDVPVTTTVEPLLLTVPTLPPPSNPTISQVQQVPAPSPATAPSTSLQDLLNFGSLFGFDHRLKTLEANFSEFMQTNQFAEAVSSILAQSENEDFLNKLDENIQKIIKEQVKEQVKVQVSKILPKIKKTVNEQLKDEVLTRASNSSKTSYDVAADLSEPELKKILIDKDREQQIILDTYGDTVTLKRCRDDEDKDEEPSAGSDWGSKRRRAGKEPESTSAPKEKTSKTSGKSTEGFKSHQRLIQPWISDMAKQADSCTSFNKLMDTPVDFLAFMMNQLKVDTLTPKLLAGPTYELMKGSCKGLVELKFFLEEVYKAKTDQLDWNNPEEHQYPHNLLKPLPLIPYSRGRRIIPFDHFINNDFEYLRGGASSRKYTTSVTKTKAADYGHIKWIEDLVPRTMWSQTPVSYDKYALWGISHWGCKHQQFYGFTVNREDDDKLYKLKEGDLKRLRIQDIEDMLLLLVQGKLTNLTVEERFAFNVFLRMFTRSIVIQQRVEDLQLGDESYQKKLNLTKPDTYRSNLKRKEAYTAYSNPRGFIYHNKDK
nr:hypothetical protein [Tanacetum cinerariifolium]